MALRSLIPVEDIRVAHVNSEDNSTNYESGKEYNAGTMVTYEGVAYVAAIDIPDTDTDLPNEAPLKWGLVPNAFTSGGDDSGLASRVSALESNVQSILTDLTAAGYGLVKTDKITASADGVKTYQEIMGELATAVLTLAQALPDDERIIITSAQLGGIGRLNTINDAYINTISSLSVQGISQSLTATETHINHAHMSTGLNASHLNRTVVNSDGVTFSNKDSDVPASGSTNEVRYALFKKLVSTD